MQPFGGHLQLLKSGKVDDVPEVAIIYEDSPGIESFYCEHDDQRVVIRLLHSSNIFLKEKHVPVHSSLLQGGYSMDAVHLPLK